MSRGVLLLEVLVALAIVVATGAFALRAVTSAEQSLDRADRRRRCNDAAVAIVRMAQSGFIGIGDLRDTDLPELLGASVHAGKLDLVELDVETQQHEEPGLMLLRVTVREVGDEAIQATVRSLISSALRMKERLR
jgi:hypothetical protein